MKDRYSYDYPRAVNTVDIVVFDRAYNVLVLKRVGNGLWCLPGGHIDEGEGPREAAVRELREETGITVFPDMIKLIDNKLTEDPTEGWRIKSIYTLQMDIFGKNNQLTLSKEEHTESDWISVMDTKPYGTVKDKKMFSDHAKIISDWYFYYLRHR